MLANLPSGLEALGATDAAPRAGRWKPAVTLAMLPGMACARLSLLLFLVGLTASRLGLLLHELAGHAGIARLLGCQLDGVRLFAFGGGYVEYACPRQPLAATLAIDFAGIALELAAGVLLLGAARARQSLLGLFLAGAGLLFVLHALFYALTGVHYGVGDGRQLHRLLGDRRTVPLAIGSVALFVTSFYCARLVARRLAAGVPGRNRHRRVATLAMAALAASALHGALLLAEQRVVADAVYAASFTPEPRRPSRTPPPTASAATQPPGEVTSERSRDPAPEPRTTPRRAVPTAPAPFPLRSVLAAGMAIAILLGFSSALRRVRADGDRTALTGAPTLARAAAACALAIAAVLAVDRLL